jgi:uncharacterized protein (DUF952 family)
MSAERPDHVYKIVDQLAWAQAAATGRFSGSADDQRDGFIHLSAPHQVARTAELYFSNTEGLLIAAFTTDSLADNLLWEPSRGGDLFPHYFAPLPTDRATWVQPLPLDSVGRPCVETVLAANPDAKAQAMKVGP